MDTRTEHERKLGRFQRYVHAGYSPHQFRGVNHVPRDFWRPKKRLRPVKGGRWIVRKLARPGGNGLVWEARCRGSASGMTAQFATQAEAVAYAQFVAHLAVTKTIPNQEKRV